MSMPEQQLQTQQPNPLQALAAPPSSPDTLTATNSPQDPQSISSQQLMQTMNPQNSTMPLQQELQGQLQNQGRDLPNFTPAINAILQTIMNACNVGQGSLAIDKQAKAIQELAAAAHLLAQASQQEGESIPAAIQVRLQGAQLDMQMQKQAQEMALAHQQQDHDQKLAQLQQQHQQNLDLQDQQHRHMLEREKHQAELHQMAHGLVMDEQAQQQQAQAQQQQQDLQAAQANHQAQLAEADQEHSHQLAEKQAETQAKLASKTPPKK